MARYHHGNLAEALTQAAVALLDGGGPEAVTLRAVARKAGVSHAAPYRHFADKAALLAAVAVGLFRELRERLSRAASRTGGEFADRVAAGGRAYIRYAVEHPARYRLLFGPSVADFSAYPEMRSEGEAALGVLVELIAQGQTAGELRAGNPLALAQATWAAVHGFADLVASGRLQANGAEVKRLAANTVAVVVDGLRGGA